MIFKDFVQPILDYTILIPTVHADSAVSGVTTMFGLNWKLFIAQLVNFAIVLFVLWKWVFTPLSKKMAERAARIEKSLKESDDIAKLHAQAEKDRQEAIRAARVEASAIIAKSEEAATKLKEDIIARAHESAKKVAEDSRRELATQREQLMADIRSEAAILVTAATEKILGEKLDAAADHKLIKRSLEAIRSENL